MLTFIERHMVGDWTIVECIRDGCEIIGYTDIYTDDMMEYNEQLEDFRAKCEAEHGESQCQ